jgi:hypothetical protein
MLAGPGVVSSNPDWERLKREMAGKTPVSAPLAFGQNAAVTPSLGGSGSMLAGQGAPSADPAWNQFMQTLAGKTPVSAPLAFGQNAAFGTPAPPVQRTPASALATRRYAPRLQ